MQFTHNLQYINPIIPSHKHLINLIYQAGRHFSPDAMQPVLKVSINNPINIKFLSTASSLDNVPVLCCDNTAQLRTFMLNPSPTTIRTASCSTHKLCIPSTQCIDVPICMNLTVTHISLHSIKWLVFVKHILHVYCKVGTKFLYSNR
jgi:hypothetical protein